MPQSWPGRIAKAARTVNRVLSWPANRIAEGLAYHVARGLLGCSDVTGTIPAALIEDFQAHLAALEQKGQEWAVVSRQAARLRQLWLEGNPAVSPDTAETRFVEGSLSGGWVLQGEDGEIYNLITDSEIFGWARPQVRRQRDHIGHDARLLEGPHGAGAAVAGLDLVHDEQDAVLVRQRAQALIQTVQRAHG